MLRPRLRRHNWVPGPFMSGAYCIGWGLRADFNPILCAGDCDIIAPYSFVGDWDSELILELINSYVYKL